MRYRLLWIIGLFAFLYPNLQAEEVSFRASAPGQVIAGQPFQLTYTINQRARDMQAPEFDHFEYLAGPYTSQSSSTSFVNGQRTSSFNLTYTYTLVGEEPGTYTISPATIRVDGTTYSSNGLRITVLPPDEQPKQQGSSAGSGNTTTSRQGGSGQSGSVGNDNIFVRTIVTKTTVYEQQALQVSYRLYVAGVDFSQLTNNIKLPEFTGFLKQELDLGDRQFELEHYNGRNYQAATIISYLLYPQHSGDIKIDPAQFEAILRVQTRQQVRSIFDDFFGSYTNVSKTLTAPAATIHVKELPAGKPAGYSGGVGHFNLTHAISAQELTTNEAITIKIDIKGSGNMKLIKTPAVDWPEGFEAYDPKVTNNFKTTGAGVSGTKSIEYLAIPREAGVYTLPAIEFPYFDTETQEYKTLKTPEYTLSVHRGAGDTDNSGTAAINYAQINKEDIKELGTDIRYINTNDLDDDALIVATPRHPAFGSFPFWLMYLVPLTVALILFILFRRRIRENSDITRVRYKKANKVAQRRLKQAKQLLEANEKEKFYEEIERASLLYLSDRLSIPTADLTKDNIADLLRRKQVDETLIDRVINVLSTAEFARYAPSSDQQKEQLLNDTTQLIDQLENCKL